MGGEGGREVDGEIGRWGEWNSAPVIVNIVGF